MGKLHSGRKQKKTSSNVRRVKNRKKAEQEKLRIGKGAVVSIICKYLHPREHVTKYFPNAQEKDRLEGFVVLRFEDRYINNKRQESAVVRHEDAVDDDKFFLELHGVVHWFWVALEGTIKIPSLT